MTIEAAKINTRYYNILSRGVCYLIALAKQRDATMVITDYNVKDVEEAPTILLSVKDKELNDL